MKIKNNWLLTLILVFGFLIRIWKIDQYPVSLNWDEISHGYNAYSLYQTGSDQWGTKWPIFNFRAYGDYPTTLNMYLSLPFIALFGLNEFSTRIVSVLAGFGLIIISYLIANLLFKNKNYSLLLAFLVAINPWTFFTSRATFQSTVAQFFFIFGIYLLLISVKKNIKFLLPAFIVLAISSYGYHNTRIALPLILLAFLIIYYKKIKNLFLKNKIYSIISIFVFLSIFLPQFLNTFNKEAQARSRWVFIINPAAINEIEVARNNFSGNPLFAKLIYNKPIYFGKTVLSNYLGFINPKIIFFDSTQNYQFNIPKNGIMYPVLLPFFYIGIFYLLKNIKKNPDLQFIFFWYILGLVPAVITSGDFPIIRAMTIIPLPFILIIFGIQSVENFDKKRLIIPILVSLLLVSNFVYLKKYFVDYTLRYSQSWQYGYKQVVEYTKANYDQYDQILVSKKYGEAHEYFLFYWPWSPSKYQHDQNLKWDYHADWYWVDAFDKFTFINDWEIKDKTQSLNKKTLLITSPNNYNSNAKLLQTINFLDGSPAFQILEIND